MLVVKGLLVRFICKNLAFALVGLLVQINCHKKILILSANFRYLEKFYQSRLNLSYFDMFCSLIDLDNFVAVSEIS